MPARACIWRRAGKRTRELLLVSAKREMRLQRRI
jgi:hypothetical protein